MWNDERGTQLTNRALYVLNTNGFETLEDVAKISRREVMKLKNIGKVTANNIEYVLRLHNLRLRRTESVKELRMLRALTTLRNKVKKLEGRLSCQVIP